MRTKTVKYLSRRSFR